jgi:outer membrane lipoprotein-sorting protein
MKSNYCLIVTLVFMMGCTTESKNDSHREPSHESDSSSFDYSLIGKKGKIVYPQFKAEVSYLTDSTLQWKTTDNNGVIREGKETIVYKKLAENLHFLNWIEEDGLTISQVIDTKNGSVHAFATFRDEKSTRGNRSAMALDGTFEFVK